MPCAPPLSRRQMIFPEFAKSVYTARPMIGEHGVPEFAKSLPKTRAAIAYAERMHDGQRRKVDGAPFIVHPVEVASLLHECGAPDDVIAAGVLHDTLEKTDASVAELTLRFGPRVTALIQAVTEDRRIRGYARRKSALRTQVIDSGREALIVFCADKLSKARELALGDTRATPLRRRNLRQYRACLEMLQAQLGDFPLVQSLQAELAAIPDPAPPRRKLTNIDWSGYASKAS
jgi:(p)ppGpp synthase/HD superfamily hydrolase